MNCPICGEKIRKLKFSFEVNESTEVSAEIDVEMEQIKTATAAPKSINMERLYFLCPHCGYNVSRLVTEDKAARFVEMAMAAAAEKKLMKRKEDD